MGKSDGRLRDRMGFTGRLLGTVAVTFVLAGIGQYVFGYVQVRATATEHSLASYAGDGKVLRDLHDESIGDPWPEVAGLLAHIQHRPGIREVALVAPDGTIVITGAEGHDVFVGEDETHGGSEAADGHDGDGAGQAHAQDPMAAGHGTGEPHAQDPMGDGHGAGQPGGAEHAMPATLHVGETIAGDDAALVEPVLHEGRSVGGTRADGSAAFVVPTTLGDGRYALLVATDGADLVAHLADLRIVLLVGFALSLLLGLPAFHLIGGRRLAADHATNVDKAVRDGLTGLANHRSFHETIRSHLSSATRHEQSLVLALLDLDGFKIVNDTAGHRRGDEILVDVGRILAGGRSGDLPFRVGGDEFAVILPNTDLRGARAACERIRDRVATEQPEIGVSIGLAVFDADGDDAETLWAAADAAMYQAKRQGKNRVVAASEVDTGDPAVALSAAASLRALLDVGRLDVAFQPIFDLDGERLLGYEALARPSALAGFDGPFEMFTTAERLGLVPELDAVCRRSILAGASDLPHGATLFINVAPAALDHELLDWEGFAAQVRAAGLEPSQVVIELTERSRLPGSVLARAVEEIRAAGFRVALDDIGTGWAGFASLLSLRPDVAKIDRGIVVAAADDPHAAAVMVAVATYARLTGAEVIAEGVETSDILEYLRDAHGDLISGVQGFLLGRPGPLDGAGVDGSRSAPPLGVRR